MVNLVANNEGIALLLDLHPRLSVDSNVVCFDDSIRISNRKTGRLIVMNAIVEDCWIASTYDFNATLLIVKDLVVIKNSSSIIKHQNT